MISFKDFRKLNEGSYKVYKPKLHHINVRPISGTPKELLGKVGEFGTDKDLSKDDHYKATIDTAHEYGKTKFAGKYELIHVDQRGQKIPAGSIAKVRRMMNESEELDESGWIGGIAKWKEAVHAKHGHSLPTFKKVAHPGSPGKSTTYATNSTTGDIVGVYQHHNKMGTVHESVELDEGAPIVVPFAHSLKQAADQRKQLAADKEKLRVSIVTPYQLGKKHKADGKPNSNPHRFVKSAGAAGNYEHNAYNRGFNESTELDESGWIGGIAKWKEAVQAKHGYALPTFKKVAQPGSPGKSTTYARNSTTGAVVGVYQHHNKMGTVHESVELDEATFVSDSPSTNASRGVNFEVKKNKEKSTGTHANGQPVEHHDVYHEGKHIGHVASYSGYKDKKAPGARIVTSRKDVRLWQATIHGGEHNRHGSVFNTTPAGSQYYQGGYTSKKDALQHLADAHNSNKNR